MELSVLAHSHIISSTLKRRLYEVAAKINLSCSLRQPVEPIGETYTSKINRFCGCRQPSWCECQRKEPHSSIKAPYTFAKILGCLPDYCQCPDGMGRAEAPPAGLFLEPLARSFGKIVGKDVPQVRHLTYQNGDQSRASA